MCQLIGKKAKFKGKKRKWWRDQKLYWQGQVIDRHGPEYQTLLDRAFNELSKNEQFRKALQATNGENLTHSFGKDDPRSTILTNQEFISRLNKLR